MVTSKIDYSNNVSLQKSIGFTYDINMVLKPSICLLWNQLLLLQIYHIRIYTIQITILQKNHRFVAAFRRSWIDYRSLFKSSRIVN